MTNSGALHAGDLSSHREMQGGTSLHVDRIIAPGSILIANDTRLPEPLRLEKDQAATGWVSVADHLDRRQLTTSLAVAGWTFFYMAVAIRRTVFGFDKQKMINTALKRVFAAVKLRGCNCLEIDDVALHSFLGLPYVSVSGHSRHIQEGLVFSGQ